MAKKENKELDFFKLRTPRKTYVSKAFTSFKYKGRMFTSEQRFVKKVFEKNNAFEFVNVNGEIVLREYYPYKGKVQINAVIYTHKETNLMEFTIQRFIENIDKTIEPIKETSFTFSQKEFVTLLEFLSDLKFIDLSNKDRFVVDDKQLRRGDKVLINLTSPDPNKITVDKDLGEIINKLSHLDNKGKETLIDALKNNVLTKYDLDVLSGRKDGLDEFTNLLRKPYTINESEWQSFFERNSWIFGYGLEYKFLNILQKEASVSSTDLDGKNKVIADFLMANSNFTVIVELKKPDTPLFDNKINRSESWRLSKDLTYAVSQILTQKAEWELNSEHKNYDSNGNPIAQITADPKAILLIGHTEQFGGNTKENLIKKKTFELYRRNLRNIDIITYDELLDRASFIVRDKESEEQLFDELPF